MKNMYWLNWKKQKTQFVQIGFLQVVFLKQVSKKIKLVR